MKKFRMIFVLVFLGLAIFGGYVISDAAEKVVTFAWDEPADLEIIERWELYWSETAGGPYTKVTDIAKTENQTVFEAPATVDITGPPGSRQTRYFVLLACGTVQEGGAPVFKCSEDSNEISEDFDIPATIFEIPVNFRILPE